MQNKASQPLIETLPMTLGVPYTDDPSAPLNIEIPLQVELPDGQTLYAAVALGGLPFHGQQQIAELIAAAWNAFTGVATSNIAPPRQCLLQIQEPPTKTEALAHYSQQAILAMGEAAHAAVAAAVPVVLPEPQHWVLETQALDREFDYTGVQKKAEHWKAIGLNPTALFTEQQLRAALLAGVSAPAAQAAWDGKLPESLQRALNELRMHCKTDAVNSLEFELRSVFEGMNTSLTTIKRMYRAASDRLDSLEASQPDPFAAPKAQADTREAQLLAFAVSEIRRDEMEHEPVLYVSKGQLGNFRDPDGPDSTAHGRYLPARVTPAGKFTTPLFAAPQDQAADFQQRVQPWMMACFGPEISADRIERNHRFLEESLELVQSLGCTASEAHQLVDYVFGRPVGEPVQEAGGVMVTLAALCLDSGLDMHACGETELARIWTKVEAIRAKQAAKPKHSPLPMHALQAQADARDADDAALIEWLSGQYLAADFHWGDPKTPVLVIEIPPTASVCGDFRTDVRGAIAAQAAQQGGAA